MFICLAGTPVRNVQFQKEKLHLVAQSELFQMACLAHNFLSSPILAFSMAIIGYGFLKKIKCFTKVAFVT